VSLFAFLVSELSCGVHAVLAIGEWGEQSASVICTIDRTDLSQLMLACCEIVEVLDLRSKFLVVVAADSHNLSEDLDGLCGLCCCFHFLSCLPRWGLVSERVKYDLCIDRCQVYLQLFYKFPTLAPHDPSAHPSPPTVFAR